PVPAPSLSQGNLNGFSTDQMLNQLGKLSQSQFMPAADAPNPS
ncbi:TPA: conjugal transfer protein TraB, partial [Enterobacter roggenkampii]|nr:conjugal transfer protein TraB [Enterobacter roggenkampii]